MEEWFRLLHCTPKYIQCCGRTDGWMKGSGTVKLISPIRVNLCGFMELEIKRVLLNKSNTRTENNKINRFSFISFQRRTFNAALVWGWWWTT